MDDRLSRLAGMSNMESQKAPKIDAPILQFNGNTGMFSVVTDGDKKEIGNEIKITILRKRKSLGSFSALQSYFTNEYDGPNDTINLYKKVDGTVLHEMSGLPAAIREKYQALRTREVIYCLYNGKLHRLDIKGGSLVGFYTYLESLTSRGLHSFQLITTIGSEGTKNDAGMAYKKMTFSDNSKPEADLDVVEANMLALNDYVARSKAYFASADKAPQKVGPSSQDLDTFVGQMKSDEAINPDDIPF